MRRRIWAVALAAALCAVLASGCQVEDWIAKFVDMDDLDGWYVAGDYSLDGGLILDDGSFVSPPFIWTGDFSISLTFSLATDEDNYAEVLLWLSRTPNDPGDNFITFYFCEGGVGVEARSVRVDGPSCTEHSVFDQGWGMDGIIEGGVNVMKIAKEGDHYLVKMNDSTIWDFVDASYESSFSYISFSSTFYGDSTEPLLVFKSLEVDFPDGDMQ